jgi:hypothetical protein
MLGRMHRGAGIALAVGAIAVAAPAAAVFADPSGGHGGQSSDQKGRFMDHGRRSEDHKGRSKDHGGKHPGDHGGGSGDHGHHHRSSISHVLLISVDGLHQSDLEWYVANHPGSELAKLVGGGAEYSQAQTPIPSDSFPGMTAQVTGGNPRTTGVYYETSTATQSCPRERPPATASRQAAKSSTTRRMTSMRARSTRVRVSPVCPKAFSK